MQPVLYQLEQRVLVILRRTATTAPHAGHFFSTTLSDTAAEAEEEAAEADVLEEAELEAKAKSGAEDGLGAEADLVAETDFGSEADSGAEAFLAAGADLAAKAFSLSETDSVAEAALQVAHSQLDW